MGLTSSVMNVPQWHLFAAADDVDVGMGDPLVGTKERTDIVSTNVIHSFFFP